MAQFGVAHSAQGKFSIGIHDKRPILIFSHIIANDPWNAPSMAKTIGSNPDSAFSAFGASPVKPQARNDPNGLLNSKVDSFTIDPFAPVAQKELQDFDLLRGEIESQADPFKV